MLCQSRRDNRLAEEVDYVYGLQRRRLIDITSLPSTILNFKIFQICLGTILVLFFSQLYHDVKCTKISYNNQTNVITSLSDVFSLSSLYIKGKTKALNNPCSAVFFFITIKYFTIYKMC